MEYDTLQRQIGAARQRLDALRSRADTSSHGHELLSETLEDLSNSLEELHVTAEALHEQGEQLLTAQAREAATAQRYQDLFEHAPDGYVVTDMNETIEEANLAAAELLQVRGDFLVGKPLCVFVADEDRPAFRSRLAALKSGDPLVAWELRMWPRSGVPFSALLSVVAACDANARPTSLRWLIRDITERKRAEMERAELYRTQEVDRRKDEFLATLAHELRNPLAPIRSAVEILRIKGPSDPETQRARDVIDRQVQQMVRLIDDLLDLSRINSGKIELRKERVALATVVGSAVESSRPLIEAGHHTLTVYMPSQPVILEADPIRLAQVVMNLLNNAAKFTPPAGHICLACELVPPSLPVEGVESEIGIRVRDNGIGIPEHMLPRIFEMFAQVDRSLERSQPGLGIGLTIVRRLTELHGGSVEACSAGLGQGSEFIVRLPLPADRPTPNEIDSIEGGSEPVRVSGPWRILVVDDNCDAADSLAMLLQTMGNEVRAAPDGPSALRLVTDFKPKLVLLDIGMPAMSGYDVASKIREDLGLGDVVLVALTGYGQEEDLRRSREAGFDHHLIKPVGMKTLEELLLSLDSR